MRQARGWLFLPLLLGACAQIVGIEDPKPIEGKPSESSSSSTTGSSGTGSSSTGSSSGGTSCGSWICWTMPNPKDSNDPNPSSYQVDDVQGIVTDLVTGLVWQRESDGNWYTWNQARSYCDGLVQGGYQDWRLPTRIELVSLIDYTKSFPAIDTAFPNTLNDGYWTSTKWAGGGGQVWTVYFDDGDVDYLPDSSTYQARCVRSN